MELKELEKIKIGQKVYWYGDDKIYVGLLKAHPTHWFPEQVEIRKADCILGKYPSCFSKSFSKRYYSLFSSVEEVVKAFIDSNKRSAEYEYQKFKKSLENSEKGKRLLNALTGKAKKRYANK